MRYGKAISYLLAAEAMLALGQGVPSAVGGEHDVPPEGFVLNVWQKRHKPESLADRAVRVAAVRDGELRLVPTFASCSVVWGAANPVEGLVAEYRARGGEWMPAERPIHFKDVGNYRSSILDLQEDVDYEMRLVSGGRTLAEGRFRTWASDVRIAKTIVIDPKGATYPIRVVDKGRPDGWVRYTVKPGAVLGGKDCKTSIFDVRGARCVVIEDVTIVGGGGYGQNPIHIENSQDVRVRNCEISGWGRTGTYVYTAKGAGRCCGSEPFNYDAAIAIGTNNVNTVVERCYIHDARERSCSWYYSHPCGTEGILVERGGHGTVLRWNDIVGSDFHRFNDCIEGTYNFGSDGGFNRDSDVYGNFCIFANDDNIELDGGQQNVRCFRNRFEAAVSAVSIQGCCASPVYVYDNLLAAGCDEFGSAFHCVKTSTFDPWWYAPYAMFAGNWLSEEIFRPALGATSRWDFRADNTITTNEVPRGWATKCPSRPLPFVLDVGFFRGIETRGDAPVVRTFKAISKDRQPFRIRKELAADWYDVEPSEGTLRPGENAFTLTIRPERMRGRRHWRSAFLVRTPEGLSRCVSVYAENADFRTADRPVPPSPTTVYASKVNPDGGEIAFDVTTEGKYHFFVKAASVDGNLRPRLLASVDGAPAKPSMLWLDAKDAVWTMVRPGNASVCGEPAFLEPFHLMPGRHVLTLAEDPGFGKVRLTGAAVSDRVFEFEAH